MEMDSGSYASKNVDREEVLQDAQDVPRNNRVDYRITGVGIWKRVIVPPNVYVVHTRQGTTEPVNIGLGISFRYNPYKDSFLLVPAALQTILINARCICVERQGILVQAYVQWIIDDIKTAYQKLNFSDPDDPMRIVNEQLREQAEAAIKDKVSAMGVDEVLADKHAIMEELTMRLREVAEGSDATFGLGLKIVTVQIKEAVVSSTRLWKNLQKPFRAAKEQDARLADIASEKAIRTQELEDRKETSLQEIETEQEISSLRHQKEREAFDRQIAEELRRHEAEQDAQRKRFAQEQETARQLLVEEQQTALFQQEKEVEREIAQMKLTIRRIESKLEELAAHRQLEEAEATNALFETEGELAVEEARRVAHQRWETKEIELQDARRKVENSLSAERIQELLVETLPQLAAAMPNAQETQRVHISSDGGPDGLSTLLGMVSGLKRILNADPPSTPTDHSPDEGDDR